MGRSSTGVPNVPADTPTFRHFDTLGRRARESIRDDRARLVQGVSWRSPDPLRAGSDAVDLLNDQIECCPVARR